jgi:hypothetical protein
MFDMYPTHQAAWQPNVWYGSLGYYHAQTRMPQLFHRQAFDLSSAADKLGFYLMLQC